jgi:hypothetical protein
LCAIDENRTAENSQVSDQWPMPHVRTRNESTSYGGHEQENINVRQVIGHEEEWGAGRTADRFYTHPYDDGYHSRPRLNDRSPKREPASRGTEA